MSLAKPIVIHKKEQLVTKNRSTEIHPELIAIEGILLEVVSLEIEVVRRGGFVFVVFVSSAMKVICSLLGDHADGDLRALVGAYHRAINLELLHSTDRRQIRLGDHFRGADIGDVAASALPRIAGSDSVQGEVARPAVRSTCNRRVGVAVDLPL